MVVAGKIFKITKQMSAAELAVSLSNFHSEEQFEEGDYKFSLISEIKRVAPKNNIVTGVFSSDYVIHVFHRGKNIPIPRTVEAMFSFAQKPNNTFLTVIERKRIANLVANKISEILFGKVGEIVETRIPPETPKTFHDNNPEDTKITFFDDVDIPNVNKLSLYGPDLNNTSLFEDYLKHGKLWYVVARSKETGYIVGITRDASVTVFNLADKNKYADYVTKEIYPITV